ncbi:MAG: leucyl/phenylalanyl-tRNA--protein transferase [Microscillaceae bacterium]|jgi:leucyl/phenylalanyl-tRNA--protein transferase|nr:leucyl/phenylalanyl-tRNA--protein transferase [Microscillaceae bacterium]
MAYYFLSEELWFPSVERADAHGILAIGGDLSPERLLLAYRSGIFPWFSEGDPIVWWSPNPRFVLYPEKLYISKSMRQILRQNRFMVTFDQDFRGVISRCQGSKRVGQNSTWITQEMLEAYCHLHELGYAHSVEVWQNNELVGGLYGVSLGKCFFGESMFTQVSNASKVGFITLSGYLQKLGFPLIDSQVYTQHLESLGAEEIPRRQYLQELSACLEGETRQGSWADLANWAENKTA